MTRLARIGTGLALVLGLALPGPAHADWVYDLVASKIARDHGQVYHAKPDPDTGTLWDRRNAAALSKHGRGHAQLVIIIEKAHEDDGENWRPDWRGDDEHD
jgi:hypothetical protein